MSLKNTVKISAAGAGKTWDACHHALKCVTQNEDRVLITTYTNKGVQSIQNEIRKQNQGVLSHNVVIKTWYDFLLSDLIKPYQNKLPGICANEIKSLDFSDTYGKFNYHRQGSKKRYISVSGNVYSIMASALAVELNKLSEGAVIHRLEQMYKQLYIDEVQDLTGYDLEIIELLLKSKIEITCSGDSKQYTYSTHNTTKNKKKSGRNIWQFFEGKDIRDLICIEEKLESKRFNNDICCFANSVYPEGKPITTCMNARTEHDGVFLVADKDVDIYYQYYSPVVLKYDKNTTTIGYTSVNFGASKGETYNRVLIFPNKPFKQFLLESKALSSPEKYYVAVTRARYSLAFVLEKLPDQIEGFMKESIMVGEREITVLKYKVS